jgi:hypothetical protein
MGLGVGVPTRHGARRLVPSRTSDRAVAPDIPLAFKRVFQSCRERAAACLVVLPAGVRERARVGAGADHRELDSLRLPASTGRVDVRPRAARAPDCGLPGAGLPVGLVSAEARAGHLTAPLARGFDARPCGVSAI